MSSTQPMAAAASSGVTNLAQPRPRKTQVLLPEQTDAQVRELHHCGQNGS